MKKLLCIAISLLSLNAFAADNAGGRSLNSATSGSKNIINTPKSDTVNGTPRVGAETQPANLSLNTFIKINKNCN